MPLPAVLAALAAGLAWVGAKMGLITRGGSDVAAVHAAAGGGGAAAAGAGSAAGEGAEGLAIVALGGGAALAVAVDSMGNSTPAMKEVEDEP
jgi:hypothetical protein